MRDAKVCFFGNPAMGSWKVRAQQVASLNEHWTSTGPLAPRDIIDHEVFCAVKRPFPTRLRLLRAMGKTTVYDVVDCWAQPADGLLYTDLTSIRAYFTRLFAELPVDGVIFPNRTMQEDLGDLVPGSTHIYHHYWPGLQPIEVRETARIVGYQGEASYLGQWQPVVEAACRRLGLRFVVNPPDLRAIDIGFAARGGVHASLLAHRYKSNVKLANFYGAGIPCLVNDSERSYHEVANGEVRFFATASELQERLAELVPFATRNRIHQSFLAVRDRFSLPTIVEQYAAYFARLAAARCGP